MGTGFSGICSCAEISFHTEFCAEEENSRSFPFGERAPGFFECGGLIDVDSGNCRYLSFELDVHFAG